MKTSDILTPIGLLLGIGCMFFGISTGDTGLNGFIDIPSVIITIGGSFAAILVTFSLDDIKSLIKMTKHLFISPKMSKVDLIQDFKTLSIKSRKDGLLSIEDNLEQIEDNFMRSGLELVIDGIESDVIVEILNGNIAEIENRYKRGAKIYKTWGSFAPAFGMLGTLIGLIQMLATLDNPDMIAVGMAKALITTFYGSLLANLAFNPMGFNLQYKGEKEADNREMILVGIISIKDGDTTRILEEKLKSFLTEKEKKEYDNESNERKRAGISAA